MFPYPLWQGRPLVPTKRTLDEMAYEGLGPFGLFALLEEARPSGEKRAEGVQEFVAERGDRSYKIVVVESFQYSTREAIHLVTHVKSVRR